MERISPRSVFWTLWKSSLTSYFTDALIVGDQDLIGRRLRELGKTSLHVSLKWGLPASGSWPRVLGPIIVSLFRSEWTFRDSGWKIHGSPISCRKKPILPWLTMVCHFLYLGYCLQKGSDYLRTVERIRLVMSARGTEWTGVGLMFLMEAFCSLAASLPPLQCFH